MVYLRRIALALILALLSGCASYGVVKNAPLGAAPAAKSYSLKAWAERFKQRPNDVQILLAFSGGGTRAAAFSYGVLKALRDTEVSIAGRRLRLLDEIDTITSVSGGSFTAAYYGLYGERIFDDYESAFLRRDVERALKAALLNPFNWFRQTGRTERAIEFYDEHIFRGATYADMVGEDRPLIIINATDLAYGVRFSFLQEYFSLLCSDLTSFPVARAVAASSAVPVLFNPVVLENHPDCHSDAHLQWLSEFRQRAAGDERLSQLVNGLSTYFDKKKRKYAHLVDGGVTDNLGLLAALDIVNAAGGPKKYSEALGRRQPRYSVVIMVNASTNPETLMDTTNRQPSLSETINATSDAQLHRFNTEIVAQARESLATWTRELSTPERPIRPYFIPLAFKDIAVEQQRFFNQLPTSFVLSGEQIDALIAAGGELLRNNPEFQKLLNDIRER